MKIRKVRRFQYITFLTGPYKGESFEYYIDSENVIRYKNWIEGTRPPVDITTPSFEGPFNGLDYEIFSNSYTVNNKEYVEQKLQQKLSIFLGELFYNFEYTDNVGIPYLKKNNKMELDIILKEHIINTEGVKSILTFDSSLNDLREYKCKFSVETIEGVILWQSTEA